MNTDLDREDMCTPTQTITTAFTPAFPLKTAIQIEEEEEEAKTYEANHPAFTNGFHIPVADLIYLLQRRERKRIRSFEYGYGLFMNTPDKR